jgi:hypothetical protein
MYFYVYRHTNKADRKDCVKGYMSSKYLNQLAGVFPQVTTFFKSKF